MIAIKIPNKFSDIYTPGVGPAALFYKKFVTDSAKAYYQTQDYAQETTDCTLLSNQISAILSSISTIEARPITSNYEGVPFGKEMKAEYLKVLKNALKDKDKKKQSCTATAIATPILPDSQVAQTLTNLLNNPAVQLPTTAAPVTNTPPLTLNDISTPKDNTVTNPTDTPAATTPTETLQESFKTNKTYWYAGIAAFVLIGGLIVYKNRK